MDLEKDREVGEVGIMREEVTTRVNNNKNYNIKEECENIREFYIFVRSKYDLTIKKIRNFLINQLKLAHARSHLVFLLECRTFDMLPKHLNNYNKKIENLKLYSRSVNKKMKNFLHYIKKKMLNLEIKDLNIHIKFLQKNETLLKIIVKDLLEENDFVYFLKLLDIYLENKLKNMKHTKRKKLNSLRLENNNKNFFNDLICNSNTNNNFFDNLMVDDNNNSDVDDNLNVPNKENWFINLTDKQIPKDVVDIVSLGAKFNFKVTPDQKDYFELLKAIENPYYKNINDTKIKRKALCIINKQIHNKSHIKINDRILQNKIVITKKFMRQNKDILFMNADKSNFTIAIGNENYINKVELDLSNENRYKKLSEDPTKILKNDVKKFLTLWAEKGVFQWDDAFSDVNIEWLEKAMLSLAYGLIKGHKEGYPIRIVVSCKGSFLYNFDKALSRFFTKYLKKPRSTIKNSLEIINFIKDINVPEDYEFVSLDVIALFPNLPHDLILEAVDRK